MIRGPWKEFDYRLARKNETSCEDCLYSFRPPSANRRLRCRDSIGCEYAVSVRKTCNGAKKAPWPINGLEEHLKSALHFAIVHGNEFIVWANYICINDYFRHMWS